MDTLCLDGYSSYEGSPTGSAPRTPSPTSAGLSSLPNTPANYKLPIDSVPFKPVYISDPMADEHHHGVPPEGVSPWQAAQSAQSLSLQYTGASGSLLGELYEHDLSPQEQPISDIYAEHHQQQQQQDWQQQQLHHSRVQLLQQQQDMSAIRRATYPYVRQERDDLTHYPLHHFLPQDEHRPQQVYAEPLPLLEHPGQPPLTVPGSDHRPHSFSAGPFDLSSHPAFYHDQETRVKLEDPAPVIVPSQVLYRTPSMDSMHQLPYIPHAPVPVQHTDDAASKETQYLRRRCFNCSQTEPPSWRRSTLNPGKIVCNKCGLYERTHLRPRPLRFDELRTGNKSRKKNGKSVPSVNTPAIKQEATDSPAITRRSSVSSSSSTSDWEDSSSVASSGSAPPSSFGSPAPSNYSLPLDHSNHSPRDGGIRLPNVDIASLSMGSPRPSTAPEYGAPQSEYFVPRPVEVPLSVSLPGTPGMSGSPALVPRDMPDAAAWSIDGGSDSNKRRPSILCKTVVA